MLRTARWLQCDFLGCMRVYNPEQYREYLRSHPGCKGIREGAGASGWCHTPEGDDLCKRHTVVHLARPVQPVLFPVSGDDHTG